MKSDFETMGGTYTREGDYLLPDLALPESPAIGIWGDRRRRFLREHQKATYTAMLLSGKLNKHLEEVDKSASEMYAVLLDRLKRRDGITERLKEENQLEWVRRMNTIRHEAEMAVKGALIDD